MVGREVGVKMFFRIVAAAFVMLAATAAFAQEREWIFDTNEEDAFLTFAVPESDDIGISFWCRIQSGEARVFLPQAGEGLEPGQKTAFTFSVAGAKSTFDAEVTLNEDGSTSAEAGIRADDKLFAAMRTADRFGVHIGSEEMIFPLGGADIESFVRVCTAP